MATIRVDAGGDLKTALEAAEDGDVVEFAGAHRVGKVRNLRGVTLRGLDATAAITSSGERDVANLRVEDSQRITLQRFTLRDATMQEARALQFFRCDGVTAEDLTTGPNVKFDHVHMVNASNVDLRRLRCDGQGGEMAGNKGVHSVYVAEGCGRVTVEDVEADGMVGAVWQVNAQDGAVPGPVTFRRVRAPSWEEGAGFNILGRVKVTLEDITLGDGGNGGIRCTSGASATLARYKIDATPDLEGAVSVLEKGTPAPPSFSTEPEPPIPPDTGGGGEEDGDLEAANARITELEAIISEAAAVLARA